MLDGLKGRRFWFALVIAVAAFTIVRIFTVDAWADTDYFAKYIDFADALRSGTIARDRIPDLSPGYLWFVAMFRSFGLGPHALRTFQIAVVSGIALIAAAIAMRIAGAWAGVLAALFVLTNKAALITACDFEPEALLLFFCALGLAMVINRDPSPPPSGGEGSRLLLAGFAFGIAVALRPVALLPAIALLAWKRKALFAIGIVAPVIVVLAVNRQMTGSMLLMDPGTVFYEGMNPNATGYAGVPPRIVKAIEPAIPGPDTMHVAYRVVASRVFGHPVTREVANRYWSTKARAFALSYPARACALLVRKAWFLVSAHDAYDLPSMASKDREVPGVWISFAVLIPLAMYGVAARFSAPSGGLKPAATLIYTLAAAIPPILFFVTARHRNPLLIGVAVLAAIGIVEIVRRRSYIAIALVALAAIVLSIRTDAQREDDYQWTSTFEVTRLLQSGDRADAATWLPETISGVPPNVLGTAALKQLTDDPSRMFSIAIALLMSDDPHAADVLLQRLQSADFHPYRRTRAVSSVAYYRARAAVQLRNGALAHQQLARARAEAAGDADVLALSAFVERDVRYAHELDRLHDPFTRDWSLARAAHAVGAEANARKLAVRAARGCPEWPLPGELR